MKQSQLKSFFFFLSSCLLVVGLISADDTIKNNSVGLREELISINLSNTNKQVGVYSIKIGFDKPTKLAVLLPGSPSVVGAVVENNIMTKSKLENNFLIRARRFLVDDVVATLIVDCQSQSGDYCSSYYQSSKQREDDVGKLISEIKKHTPSITEVWLVGTSMGTISSSFMPLYNNKAYAGVIHTSTITDPYAKNSYSELGNFNYNKIQVPQFFIHHIGDQCSLTPYSGAHSISERFNIPLVTVYGGNGFIGKACKALTQHGFMGKEQEVMKAVNEIIRSGKTSSLHIN